MPPLSTPSGARPVTYPYPTSPRPPHLQDVPTLLEMLVELLRLFGEVALNDPLAALMLLFGVVLFGVTFGVGGLLALGATAELAGTLGRAVSRSRGRAR